jgi:hypothetical protein
VARPSRFDPGTGTFTYDPTTARFFQQLPNGAVATDSFTYSITDGQGRFSTATVTLAVEGRNNAPVLHIVPQATNILNPALREQQRLRYSGARGEIQQWLAHWLDGHRPDLWRLVRSHARWPRRCRRRAADGGGKWQQRALAQ